VEGVAEAEDDVAVLGGDEGVRRRAGVVCDDVGGAHGVSSFHRWLSVD